MLYKTYYFCRVLRSKEQKQKGLKESYYDKAMNFALAYAKNLTYVSFLAGATNAAAWVNLPK
jgi:hypothetical protein